MLYLKQTISERKLKHMKKQLVSLIMASAMLTGASAALAAENANPGVYINGSEIVFSDQKAIIKDDRTLVPARGVFEALGATVEWDDAERKVTIDSEDNIKHIVLTINNAEMEVYTFTSVLHADKSVATLDVPPQIQNDRTLIPLRAISEALNTTVDWDQEKYRVDITSGTQSEENSAVFTLSSEATEAKAGDTVDLIVNLNGMGQYANAWVTACSVGLKYDKVNFELVSSTLLSKDGEDLSSSIHADNTEYGDDILKTAHVTIDDQNAVVGSGKILKFTFKSLTGQKGEFALYDNYVPTIGYANTLLLQSGDIQYNFDALKSLKIDTTPVVIN